MHPQIPDFQIVLSQPNVVILSLQTIHQWKAYLFSFQMMYTSQLKKIYPYDWFCGPGSHFTYEYPFCKNTGQFIVAIPLVGFKNLLKNYISIILKTINVILILFRIE